MGSQISPATREAAEFLTSLGYHITPRGLVKRRYRPGAPPFQKDRRGHVVYDHEALRAWWLADSRSFIDLTRTALGRWMLEHRYTAPTFATETGIGVVTVRHLLGHRNAASAKGVNFSSDVLELVSLKTGVPCGQLVEEAMGRANGRDTG